MRLQIGKQGSNPSLKELRRMVDTVQSIEPEAAGPKDDSAWQASRMAILRKVHAWVTAWSDVARAVIKRRDMLIRLGIARRKGKAVADPAPVAPTPSSPATPSAPVASEEAHGPASRAA
jgi:hypothetical protein